jgi:aspartate-semialdehyde dehydrogenase
MGHPTLAVVGATGSVGTVMLELLTSRRNGRPVTSFPAAAS